MKFEGRAIGFDVCPLSRWQGSRETMAELPDAVVRVMIVEDRKLAVHSGPAAVTRAAALGLLRQGEDKVPDC